MTRTLVRVPGSPVFTSPGFPSGRTASGPFRSVDVQLGWPDMLPASVNDLPLPGFPRQQSTVVREWVPTVSLPDGTVVNPSALNPTLMGALQETDLATHLVRLLMVTGLVAATTGLPAATVAIGVFNAP